MKTIRILAAAGAAMLLGAVSCTEASSDKKDNKTIGFQTIEHQQTFTLQGSAKDYGTDRDILFSCEADILMPENIYGSDADTLRTAIIKTAFDTTATSGSSQLIEDVFRATAAESGYMPVDTVVPENVYDGCLIVEGDIAALTSSILSYSVTVSRYEPMAAHGMYGSYFINYDLKNGKIFNLSDIVTTDGLAALPAILRKIARNMRNYVGPTDLTALPADGNFYIDLRNNLVFVYQPYEIASYAQGLIEIPIPAYQISENLTPYGKSLFNL